MAPLPGPLGSPPLGLRSAAPPRIRLPPKSAGDRREITPGLLAMVFKPAHKKPTTTPILSAPPQSRNVISQIIQNTIQTPRSIQHALRDYAHPNEEVPMAIAALPPFGSQHEALATEAQAI